MREFSIGKRNISVLEREIECEYFVLIEETGGRLPCESYGIRICKTACGESAVLRDLTLASARVIELANLLRRNGVTPVALRDVVEDWL